MSPCSYYYLVNISDTENVTANLQSQVHCTCINSPSMTSITVTVTTFTIGNKVGNKIGCWCTLYIGTSERSGEFN